MASQEFGQSQVPVDPSFRHVALNSVAVVPLLSHDKKGELIDSRSAISFTDLMVSLRRHGKSTGSDASLPGDTPNHETTNVTTTTNNNNNDNNNDNNTSPSSDLLLVVPHSTLTRPGDWRYTDTPLKAFHWQHGCQRLRIHDGRPQNSRTARDKLLSSSDWIDLVPSRRTAAVIGVLNMHDCKSTEDLDRACDELHQWAVRYATPPYEVTAHGRSFARDRPVERLFVYDSFDEANQTIDLSQSKMGSSILAFPPSDEAHEQMMDLHLNLVVSDLTVAIFKELEQKIRESHEIAESGKTQPAAPKGLARKTLNRFVSNNSSEDIVEEAPSRANKNLGISNLADLLNPDNKVAKDASTSPALKQRRSEGDTNSSTTADSSTTSTAGSSTTATTLPQLMTPLDTSSPGSAHTAGPPPLSVRDQEAVRLRNAGRREKFAADLCLLAGSPLDGYERYLKAAEMLKSGMMDPLWHASALEGCAAAHIAMAEAGGYSVDEYLENNFQLPEDIMTLAREDATTKRQMANSNKQTLPEVVFALCDEALNILSRSERVGHLYTELLLKLAGYCAEESELHLRCAWGVGLDSYQGELGDQPRWKRTSVSKLSFNPMVTKDGNSMLAISTQIRLKRMCELLTRAVTVDSLDPATRIDVGARCARLCLNGIKPAHWSGTAPSRYTLPRKAAYFIVVAAESLSVSRSEGTEQMASDLWFLATKLYAISENPIGGGGDYGWATLRAFCLACLSMHGTDTLSLEAAEQLMSLLVELEPIGDEDKTLKDVKKDETVDVKESKDPVEVVTAKTRGLNQDKTSASFRAQMSREDADLQEAITAASNFAKNVRTSYSNFTATSTYLTNQSKWAHDNPIPHLELPLSDTSPLCSSLIALKSVWPQMNFQICSEAQKLCADRTAVLRRAIPTTSKAKIDYSSVYGFNKKILPLYVSSALSIHSDEALELECIVKRAATDESKQGAMATFFNPYANKNTKKLTTVTVAEEEERAMLVKFGNRLAVPLEVQRGQLKFDSNSRGRVKAAALSFIIPPKATDYPVHFPFTVLTNVAGSEIDASTMFEVQGLSLTCFGRSFFLPILTLNSTGTKEISGNFPESAASFPHRTKCVTDEDDIATNPRIETYPCQPKLQIHFSETRGPAETVPIALCDGEIFTVPALRLVNDAKGKIERLQIISTTVDAGKAINTKLYDSDELADECEPEIEFVRDLIFEANPKPYKLRVLSESLKLSDVNGSDSTKEKENTVVFQFGAAHNFCKQEPNGRTVRIQFRYRAADIGTEVWRKRDLLFNLTHVRGPRFTSIVFRPDLAQDSGFADLSGQSRGTVKTDEDSSTPLRLLADIDYATRRVGMDSEASVCNDTTVFVLTIANDTRSVLRVSCDDGPIGGFPNHPLENMTVQVGVSAKIPIIMSRIDRVDSKGDPIDVIQKLVAKTNVIWEQYKEGDSGPIKARGRIRLPYGCLEEIVNKQPSILSQICTPPCTIALKVGGKASHASILSVALGSPIDLSVGMDIESWVPTSILECSSLTIEFRCAKKDRFDSQNRGYVWAGKLRHTSHLGEGKELSHGAKVIFCRPGKYVVSACARISRLNTKEPGATNEEVWWAPLAQALLVEDTTVTPQ